MRTLPALAIFLLAPLAAGQGRNFPANHEVVFPEGQTTVEIPMRFEGGSILVDVVVQDKPMVFLLESGWWNFALWTPRKLGIEPKLVEGSAHARKHSLQAVQGFTIAIGDLRLEDVMLEVTSEGALASLGPHAIDGVLGGMFLSKLVVEIDFMNERLRLHDPRSHTPDEGSTVVPLERERGFVYARAGVTIDGDDHDARLIVDLGATHALALRRDRLPVPQRAVSAVVGRGLDGVLRGSLGRIEALRLGPTSADLPPLNGVLTSFLDAGASIIAVGSDGNLGTNVLRRFHTTIDWSRGRMYLRPNEDFGKPFPFSTSGLQPQPWLADDGTVALDSVYAGSPGARAGITTEDRVMAVDGRPARELGLPGILKLLSQEPGETVRLELVRGGEARELTLELATVL